MSELPSGTVTFLFTDIEGSTQLIKQLGGRYSLVLREHQRILRAAFAAHGGREVDTQGDSFFVAFRRGKDAVLAAVGAQRDLAAHPWPDGADVKVRMGLHTGEPEVGEDRYVGLGVHKAARIGAAGHGGQVLLSRTTRELVEDDLPTGVTIRDLGERRLKDLDRPERLSQLVIEGLESEFGQLKTLDVELRRKRRRMYAGAALIGVLAAAVAIPVFALGQGLGGGGANVAPNSVAVIDAEQDRVAGSVAVGVRPGPIAVSNGSVWVANTDDQSVTRIDSETREVVRTIPVGEYPSDVAVLAGSPWVALGGPQQVRQIAPERNEAEEPVAAIATDLAVTEGELPHSCSRTNAWLAAGAGKLWLACHTGSDYGSADASTIDPGGAVVRLEEALFSSAAVGLQFSDVAYGLGSVWFANHAGNAVTQIDATSGRQVREITVGRGPRAVSVGFGSVWVANGDDNTVSRLEVGDAVQPVAVATIPVDDHPVDVAVGDDAVWVVNRGDRTISRIDPQTNAVVATIELDNEPVRVAAGEGAVWVTVQEPAEG